ncbi:MAG: alanine racemase [Proteobacteria bacterium]|nr:alanine racemase [Pseudomonadota bacterium]
MTTLRTRMPPPSDPPPGDAGGVLRIDLGAIAANYRNLQARLAAATCGAVVKADAYGLGAAKVAKALWGAGCRDFFVALIDEGVEIRAVLPEADIYAFCGATPETAAALAEHRLIPALNDLGQIEAYSAYARTPAREAAGGVGSGRLAALIHIDTGMTRLGLEAREVAALADDPRRLAGIEVKYVMSHLAAAEEPADPLNARQLAAFNDARARLEFGIDAPASFANSSGIFLGPDYHFDLARPGAALYGIAPRPGVPNPMAQVVSLQGKILQLRDVDSPMTVGYGATHRVRAKGRIATVGVGYADGYFRALGDRGHAYIGETRVPVVGRVSMDLITLDVSDVPPDQAVPGGFVDLISDRHPVDALAAEAGTIGYEILTALGRRYHRIYSHAAG